jgi:DNA-binding protein
MAEKAEKTEKKKAKADDNVVYVGKKPTMSYVFAVITQFSEGAKEVHIKARGKSISRAVDVAEVVKHKFVTDVKRSISIDTEKITGEQGGELNVSTIAITMKK